MDSWQNLNYLTRNRTLWVELMNLSTVDWNIGALPSGVIAITGSLNDSYDFPENARVIENAGRTHVGSSEIEVVVYGIASGFAILCTAIWIYFNRDLKPESYDPVQQTDPETASHDTENGTTTGATTTAQGMTAAEFRKELDTRYYEPVETDIELYEEDKYLNAWDPIAPTDVENMTALLRKMYGADLVLWSYENSAKVSDQRRNQLRDESDAAWAEVQSKIDLWSQRDPAQLRPDERQLLNEIRGIVSKIPQKRYGERPGRV